MKLGRILVSVGHQVASLADAWIETIQRLKSCEKPQVASLADAWIETFGLLCRGGLGGLVASLADAWIETFGLLCRGGLGGLVASLADAWIETPPNRANNVLLPVASLADAWIETNSDGEFAFSELVASLADAWIETSLSPVSSQPVPKSRPSRTRGLKLCCFLCCCFPFGVASLADAWIETAGHTSATPHC